jgi:hypothetical protein
MIPATNQHVFFMQSPFVAAVAFIGGFGGILAVRRLDASVKIL